MDMNLVARKALSFGRRQAVVGAITGITVPLLTSGQTGEAKKGKGKNKNKDKNKNNTRCNRCPQQGCCACSTTQAGPVGCTLIDPGEDLNMTSRKCSDYCASLGVGSTLGDLVVTLHPQADEAALCSTEKACVRVVCPVA